VEKILLPQNFYECAGERAVLYGGREKRPLQKGCPSQAVNLRYAAPGINIEHRTVWEKSLFNFFRISVNSTEIEDLYAGNRQLRSGRPISRP
jgi:hypothetical protein